MRIALLVPHFSVPKTGGVGPHGRRLAEELAALGHEPLVLSEEPELRCEGIRVETIGKRWSSAALLRVLRRLRGFEPDAVVAMYTPFNFGPRSLVPVGVAIACALARVRSAAYLHECFYAARDRGPIARLKAAVLALRDYALVRAVDVAFVANEPKRARVLAAAPGLRASRVAIVPIGANIEPPRGVLWDAARADPELLVSFGVVMPRRRFELLIDALAVLRARGRNVRLRIVGNIFDTEYAQALRARALAARLAECVVLTGALEDAEVSRELLAANAFAYALVDGLISSSGTLLAAFAHGIPVVATRCAADEPRLSACALRADPEPHALADAFERALDDREAAQRMGRRGRALYEAEFSWTSIARGIVDRLDRPYAVRAPLVGPSGSA